RPRRRIARTTHPPSPSRIPATLAFSARITIEPPNPPPVSRAPEHAGLVRALDEPVELGCRDLVVVAEALVAFPEEAPELVDLATFCWAAARSSPFASSRGRISCRCAAPRRSDRARRSRCAVHGARRRPRDDG